MVAVPPVPQFLTHRPTKNGLVVPYISLEAGGQAFLGQTRGARVAECLTHRLCQVCGRALEYRPYLFLVTQRMIDERFSREPALHPVCAIYSIRACPMIGGRMATYAKHQPDLAGTPCDKPGCDCPGIVTTDSSRAGDPAEPWFQTWYGDYAIGIRDGAAGLTVGNITGAVLLADPVKVRPITDIPGTRKRATT